MIDGWALANVMSTFFFKKIDKDENDLKPTDTTMVNITRSGLHTYKGSFDDQIDSRVKEYLDNFLCGGCK